MTNSKRQKIQNSQEVYRGWFQLVKDVVLLIFITISGILTLRGLYLGRFGINEFITAKAITMQKIDFPWN